MLLDAIRDHQVVVVAGETGSGKSTQLPKLCLELGLGRARASSATRSPAASRHGRCPSGSPRSSAPRSARPSATRSGSTTGSAPTRYIKVMTDGILLAEIQRDRQLRAYEVLIIDEAHERSLNIDFLLGYLRQLLPQRPDLKVIVTSATIDTARFAAHFGDAPVVEVSGRSYPVEVRYRPDRGGGRATTATRPRRSATPSQELIASRPRRHPRVPLRRARDPRHRRGARSARPARAPSSSRCTPACRRPSSTGCSRRTAAGAVVLATNVAETSLTVPGIVGVVDPGTARISRYNRRTKVQRLPIEADLAGVGRPAGRPLRPRRARHLHPPLLARRTSTVGREFTEPEILRTNLASVILQMAALGLGDDRGLPLRRAARRPQHQGRHPAPRGARRPRSRAAIATTCASPSSVGGSPGSRSTRAWRAWCSRRTATAWWPRCS